MSPKSPPSPAVLTFWHPLFMRALRQSLSGRYFRVDAEYPLSQEPLRPDAVVVRRRRLPAGFRPPSLGGLVQLLGDHTLISFKGATARLAWTDLVHLLVCAGLYCIEHRIRRLSTLRLIVVAPRLSPSFRKEAEARRGRLRQVDQGTWRITGQDHLCHVIEAERASDQLLHVFSPAFLRDPLTEVSLLSDAEQHILNMLFKDIRQFRQDPHVHLRYADFEEVAMSVEELIKSIIQDAPEDELARYADALPLKARLQDLSPEARLEGLSPEERARLRALLDQPAPPTGKPRSRPARRKAPHRP